MKLLLRKRLQSILIKKYHNLNIPSINLDVAKLKQLIKTKANISKSSSSKYFDYIFYGIIGLTGGIILATATIISNTEFPLLSLFPSSFFSSASLLPYSSCSVTNENDHASINNGINSIPFTRNFVADAADIASPAVVNIMTQFEGFLVVGASAGSGFIISKDGKQQTILLFP